MTCWPSTRPNITTTTVTTIRSYDICPVSAGSYHGSSYGKNQQVYKTDEEITREVNWPSHGHTLAERGRWELGPVPVTSIIWFWVTTTSKLSLGMKRFQSVWSHECQVHGQMIHINLLHSLYFLSCPSTCFRKRSELPGISGDRRLVGSQHSSPQAFTRSLGCERVEPDPQACQAHKRNTCIIDGIRSSSILVINSRLLPANYSGYIEKKSELQYDLNTKNLLKMILYALKSIYFKKCS